MPATRPARSKPNKSAGDVALDRFRTEVTGAFSKDLGLQHLTVDNRLAAWWVYSQLTDEDADGALRSLTRPADGGVDAVVIDGGRKVAYLVQCKLHTNYAARDARPSLLDLGRWKALLSGPDDLFNSAIKKLTPTSKQRLTEARHAVKDDGYSLVMQFVSTGRAASEEIKNQQALADIEDANSRSATFEYYGGRELRTLFDDYFAGVRPITELRLEVEPMYITTKQRADRGQRAGVGGDVDMELYLIPGNAIAVAVDKYGPRLFARNIRGYLGEANAVARAITRTINDEPERFRFMNNGLTIVCNHVAYSADNTTTITLKNPQIVNGQQTSFALARAPRGKAAAVQVITRVIEIRRHDSPESDYDRLVGEVVQATNWQTKVSAADLRSNDRGQIRLGRELRRLRHYYARKKTPKSEQQGASGGLPIVSRDEVAEAVGSCLEESLPHRVVKDRLYEDEATYQEIFNPDEALRNLLIVYLWRAIQKDFDARRTLPERKQGKWLALFYIWKVVGPSLLPSAVGLVDEAKAVGGSKRLSRLAHEAGDAVEAFYRAKAGKGYPDDAVRFFKMPKLYEPFRTFLRSRAGAKSKVALKRALDDL